MTNHAKKVVIIGGGTGIYPVVRACKHLELDISTIVATSDSGGSTGRIRDEFGFPPVGDLRQSLAALAEDDGEEWIRKILLYRFEKGEGLAGHNLGNLLLTALQDMTGSTTKALEIAEKVFRLNGNVIPVTEASVQLEITYRDGTKVVGEHTLDESSAHSEPIASVQLIPNCVINPSAAAVIRESEAIIIGPGDLYASLLAVLVVPGMKQALASSSAKLIYMMNLMTRSTQTANMSARDHITVIESLIEKKLDLVIINSGSIPDEILALYQQEKEYPVKDDLGTDSRVIRANLIEETQYKQSALDTAHRSVLRHNQDALQAILGSAL